MKLLNKIATVMSLAAGLISIVFTGLLPVQAQSDTGTSLTAATYNIAGVRYLQAGKIGKQLKKEKVEVAAIQELKLYSSQPDIRKEIATTQFPYHFFARKSYHNEGASGEAVFSAYPIEEETMENYVVDGNNSQMYERIVFEKEGRKIAFYQTHLAWQSAVKRRTQLEILMDTVEKDPVPYKIVAGDFNLHEKGELIPLMRSLNPVNGKSGEWLQTFWDNDSYEGWDFDALDNILVSRNIRIDDVKVLDEEKISDHYGLVARLTLLDHEPYTTEWADHVLEEAQVHAEKHEDYSENSIAALQLQMEKTDSLLKAEKKPAQDILDIQTERLYDALKGLTRMSPWRKVDGRWMYRKDGYFVKNAWLEEDGKVYCFDEDGFARTGLYKENEKLYYFLSDASLAVDTWIARDGTWYLANHAGNIVTGWNFRDTDWYYMNASGAVVTGWLTQAGKTYFLKNDGAMATGTVRIEGKLYYFDKKGVWQPDVHFEDTNIDQPDDNHGHTPGTGYIEGIETGHKNPSSTNQKEEITADPLAWDVLTADAPQIRQW